MANTLYTYGTITTSSEDLQGVGPEQAKLVLQTQGIEGRLAAERAISEADFNLLDERTRWCIRVYLFYLANKDVEDAAIKGDGRIPCAWGWRPMMHWGATPGALHDGRFLRMATRGSCPNRAKYSEGGAHFCGHHAPSKIGAREAEKKAKREAEYQSTQRRWAKEKAAKAHLLALVEKEQQLEVLRLVAFHACDEVRSDWTHTIDKLTRIMEPSVPAASEEVAS